MNIDVRRSWPQQTFWNCSSSRRLSPWQVDTGSCEDEMTNRPGVRRMKESNSDNLCSNALLSWMMACHSPRAAVPSLMEKRAVCNKQTLPYCVLSEDAHRIELKAQLPSQPAVFSFRGSACRRSCQSAGTATRRSCRPSNWTFLVISYQPRWI